MSDLLNSAEFIRYSRQIMLDDWQESGQLRLKAANVVVIGCGGLGNMTATLLAGAGVGHITLVDDDEVELSNLPRQISFEQDDIANSKVFALANRLREQNEQVIIDALHQRFDESNAKHLIANADLVLDCSDNFACRFLVNQHCLNQGVALLSASVIGWSGQLMLIDPKKRQHGCYQCLFEQAPLLAQNCASNGVSGPAVNIIASYQANQALLFLLGKSCELATSIVLVDSKTMKNQVFTRTQREGCHSCQAALLC